MSETVKTTFFSSGWHRIDKRARKHAGDGKEAKWESDRLDFMMEYIKHRRWQDMLNPDRWCLLTLPHQGGGCGLMTRTRKFEEIIKGMNYVSVYLVTLYKAFYPFTVYHNHSVGWFWISIVAWIQSKMYHQKKHEITVILWVRLYVLWLLKAEWVFPSWRSSMSLWQSRSALVFSRRAA